jgi:hypothetical protein
VCGLDPTEQSDQLIQLGRSQGRKGISIRLIYGLIQVLKHLQPLSLDTAMHAPAVSGSALPRDELLSFQAIDHSRDTRRPLDHTARDGESRQPFWFSAAQDPEDVILLSCDAVGSENPLEKGFYAIRGAQQTRNGALRPGHVGFSRPGEFGFDGH